MTDGAKPEDGTVYLASQGDYMEAAPIRKNVNSGYATNVHQAMMESQLYADCDPHALCREHWLSANPDTAVDRLIAYNDMHSSIRPMKLGPATTMEWLNQLCKDKNDAPMNQRGLPVILDPRHPFVVEKALAGLAYLKKFEKLTPSIWTSFKHAVVSYCRVNGSEPTVWGEQFVGYEKPADSTGTYNLDDTAFALRERDSNPAYDTMAKNKRVSRLKNLRLPDNQWLQISVDVICAAVAQIDNSVLKTFGSVAITKSEDKARVQLIAVRRFQKGDPGTEGEENLREHDASPNWLTMIEIRACQGHFNTPPM